MQQITTINPATEQTITSYDVMSYDMALAKLDRAHNAFLKWKTITYEERGQHLRKIATVLRESSDDLAELMTQEMGKLLRDGKTEVELCAQIFEYTAEHGPSVLADEERSHSGGDKTGIVTHCPIGVIYSIQPWNFPIYQPVRVLAANLMAGNAVVLKHAEICTGSGLKLKEVCDAAGLPEGLFEVIIIDHDTSDKIIEHDLVRGVTMTGSDGAGSHIGQQATKNLKKSVLELGSNDAYVILQDADIDLAVKTCLQGRLYNNGQTCVSAKRFIVTDAVYDPFVEAFVDQMKDVELGDPMNEETELGPLSSKDQFDTICKQVEDSLAHGAELLCGGHPPERTGQYYPATVLANCKPGSPAYDDELFGPVASIIRAKDDEDAMRIANDSRYGLGGGLFTSDQNKAIRLARDHFDTGMVRINSFGAADPNMPFGGVKDSGFGREHGGFGMKEFTNAKAIYLP
ncbi:NAD-dependent succinate-semialdehyde dehydrogenase [uncultured Roseobacter sp.]|uniref:NAD-dependent succinate-semialdehyde dehydrogenase n=1 Tax=uncultured Roseobacter sp. TaxID=114847 RepID=UPI002605AAD9|nr:NAD-dependent succinate-semialdehyde dehydrogenase [uncultured Roseobacter sp.]